MSKKSKLTLIVDGNWLLISRMAVIHSRYADDNQLCRDLKVMMIKSMNIVLKQFPMIDNIIFVADGGSWRNYLEKPDFLTDDYKGTRIQDPSINWDMIFESYEDFLTKLSQEGITVCKESGIEGDDWCCHWSNLLNSQGTNCIIWTKDKDLTQLVKMNKDKCFTVVWNKDNGLVAPDVSENDMDFLFNYDFNINETLYNEICTKSKNVTNIEPYKIVIEKILKGDISDNIIPIALRKSKSKDSDKKFRISQKDINYDLDVQNDIEVKNYFSNLLESKSYKDRVEQSYDEIIEHFNYNKQLIMLDKTSYPDYIIDIFNNYQIYNTSCDISKAEQQITMESNKLQGILDII